MKKGGCGAKFPDNDERITEQGGKVENDDPYTLTNTIDKMAQKRALVAASLNLGFSEHYTQDQRIWSGLSRKCRQRLSRQRKPPYRSTRQTQEELETVARSITARLASSDDGVIQKGVKEWRDLVNDEKTGVWAMLDKPTRKALKALTQPAPEPAPEQSAGGGREEAMAKIKEVLGCRMPDACFPTDTRSGLSP